MFGKKQVASLDEIISMISKLDDSDKEKLIRAMSENSEEESVGEDVTDAQNDDVVEADGEPVDEKKAEDEETKEVDDSEDASKATELNEALLAKVDALIEEFTIYKERVDSIYQKIEEADGPAETVGLGKQRNVEPAEDEEEMSAHEYAMKHAKF